MKSRVKTIALVATLDTKGDEAKYLKECIQKSGYKIIVIDTGVIGSPHFEPDITREEVARKGGESIEELVLMASRGKSIEVMAKGAALVVKELYDSGRLDGIIAIGGSSGTTIGCSAMRALPIGVPKLMVSSSPFPGDVSRFVETKDIAMLFPVADILGLNTVTRKVLANAAGAIIGMVETKVPVSKGRRLIGVTMLGVTTPAVLNVKPLLEKRGYDVMAFADTSKALDELVANGLIDGGVLDLTPQELVNSFIPEKDWYNPLLVPDPQKRLKSVTEKGLPLIIVPGALDMFIFTKRIEEIPNRFRKRRLYKHGPEVTLARTNEMENRRLGEMVARIANRTQGSVSVIIPLRGFSAVDKEGQPFYDPALDKTLAEALKINAKDHVKIVEIDAHINDKDFAEKLINIFDEMVKLIKVK